MKLVLMFLIHWGYSLLCLLACAGIWFYIGKAAPGVNSGIASEFSLVRFLRGAYARLTGGRQPEQDDDDQQFIINPIEPSMTTRPTHLNEVNTDFADRSQFHQVREEVFIHYAPKWSKMAFFTGSYGDRERRRRRSQQQRIQMKI